MVKLKVHLEGKRAPTRFWSAPFSTGGQVMSIVSKCGAARRVDGQLGRVYSLETYVMFKAVWRCRTCDQFPGVMDAIRAADANGIYFTTVWA